VVLVKYKDLNTDRVISDSNLFAQQFQEKYCPNIKLATIQRLVSIIKDYVVEENFLANLSMLSYSNHYYRTAGQKYTQEEIDRGVKRWISYILNDIYECDSAADVEEKILNRPLKAIDKEIYSNEEALSEKILKNHYLNPVLHFLGIIRHENISLYVDQKRFPKNYPQERIHAIFRDMFSNIKEATIRNLNPTRLEDFTEEERANPSFRKAIADALNKGMTISNQPLLKSTEQRVRFSDELNIYTYNKEDHIHQDVITTKLHFADESTVLNSQNTAKNENENIILEADNIKKRKQENQNDSRIKKKPGYIARVLEERKQNVLVEISR
jgi:hypothetical protein